MFGSSRISGKTIPCKESQLEVFKISVTECSADNISDCPIEALYKTISRIFDKVISVWTETPNQLKITDIDSQIIPVVKDRTGRIFAGQNMATININRSAIQADIEKAVSQSVEDLFGIQPHSLQIAGIIPSPAFMASNEAAVKAKNDAVAAENTKRTRQFEADQIVIKAKGDADSAIEAARGRSQSTLLEAQANKTKQVLEGEGLEARLAAEIKPFGSPDKYIDYLKAKATLNWNGQQPQIVAGTGSTANLVLPVTIPGTTGPANTK